MSDSVVDTQSAQEFMHEILAKVRTTDLAAIAGDLERKSAAVQALVRSCHELDGNALRRLLRWFFSVRRSAERIIDALTPAGLASAIGDLLHGSAPLPDRIDQFDEVLADFPREGFDLPGELLHFAFPDRYWLWTRWIWDPTAETGALRLVTTDETDLGWGARRGEVYLAVGRATAFVEETGKAAGFTTAGPGLFGTDVFLAAVYGIYMNTVLSMRMTQEFTRMVPELPNLCRRLLGVYHRVHNEEG